ncbi:GrpB family protein [Eubacteriales bacterium OttesenSCG-928-N13]|nr:GrpB family protein [Eubacteriales bacterium OttesenSCG-928-N13]
MANLDVLAQSDTARDRYVDSVTIGERTPLNGTVLLADYNPDWPMWFEGEAKKIKAILGDKALHIHHVGSTSVPGLCAKPVIDILLFVRDSAEEADYVPLMEAARYRLRIREPDWYEHRLFKGPDVDINLHVFSEGCEEPERMLAFRDWLRMNESDRELYASVKRELANRAWTHIQHYADAKSKVVADIMARAGK